MQLQTREIANVLLIQVAGRIDHTTAKQFADTLLPQLDSCTGDTRKALLDLSGVDYMSSAGLRVLVLAARQCQKQNGEIVLAALSPILQELFRISRFTTVFKVFATVQGALESLSPTVASACGGA